MELAQRLFIEKTIAMQAITSLQIAGFDVFISYGEGEREAPIECNLQACDEELLIVYWDGVQIGVVVLVHGNDGYDVINDYTVSLEEHLGAAKALSDFFDEQENGK